MPNILQDVLPSDFKLLADVGTRTLGLFSISSSSILAQEQLTKNEWALLMVFVKNHPHYAPYETLLASLTSLSPDTCRGQIHEAQQKGTNAVKQELKPVYRALTGLRKKLKAIYPPLSISLLRDAGYVLMVSPNTDIGKDTTQEAP